MFARVVVAAAVVLGSSATPVAAQVFDMGSLTATLSVDHVTQSEKSRAIGRVVRDELGDSGRLSFNPDAGVASASGASSLVFRSSAARRQRNYTLFVQRTRVADPSAAERLAASLRADPLAQVTPDLARAGLEINNVAHAYAAYWTEAWEAAHRRPIGTSSPQQREAVKQQAASAILATPEMAGASDADKQQFAEALWLQTLGLSAAREQARGNSQQMSAIATAARKGASQMGLDLDAMTLTEDGFAPASGKRGEADQAGDDERLADVGSGVVLGAAVVGLGVGGFWLLKRRAA